MYNPVTSTTFSKSILAGLLTGIIEAILNLIYMIVYRESTEFAKDAVIMPLTIFVGFPILMVLGGYAYFLLQKHMRWGTTWFMVICLVSMIVLLIITIQDTILNHGVLFSGARGLFLGMIAITFLIAAFFIPYFARHSKIYL